MHAFMYLCIKYVRMYAGFKDHIICHHNQISFVYVCIKLMYDYIYVLFVCRG